MPHQPELTQHGGRPHRPLHQSGGPSTSVEVDSNASGGEQVGDGCGLGGQPGGRSAWCSGSGLRRPGSGSYPVMQLHGSRSSTSFWRSCSSSAPPPVDLLRAGQHGAQVRLDGVQRRAPTSPASPCPRACRDSWPSAFERQIIAARSPVTGRPRPKDRRGTSFGSTVRSVHELVSANFDDRLAEPPEPARRSAGPAAGGRRRRSGARCAAGRSPLHQHAPMSAGPSRKESIATGVLALSCAAQNPLPTMQTRKIEVPQMAGPKSTERSRPSLDAVPAGRIDERRTSGSHDRR